MNLHVRHSGPRADDARASVVFIHGFPLDGSLWDPQLGALPDGWRALAPDLRGSGSSPLDPDDLPTGAGVTGVANPDEPVLTMDRLADDIAALIEAECDGLAVVCGLSMGGYVAFALLRQRPDLVRGLVLADTRASADTPEARENRAGTADQVRSFGANPVATTMIPKLLARTTIENAPDVVGKVRRMITGTPATTIIAALAGMAARPDSTDDLPDIDVPTLVVVGEHDRITPPDGARDMADRIPDAELAVIPDAAHLAGLENPTAFNDALIDWLNGL